MSEIILVALIGFGGVIITQLSLHYGDSKKADRERAKDERARAFELKKQLYMETIAAFNDGISLLVSVQNTPPDRMHELTFSQSSSRALASKDLIASKEVIEATHKAMRSVSLGLMDLLKIKVHENKLYMDIEASSRMVDALLEIQSSVTNEIQALNNGDVKFHSRIAELIEEAQVRKAVIDTRIAAQQEMAARRGELLKSIGTALVKLLPTVKAAIAEATIIIRKDLGVASDDPMVERLLMMEDLELRSAASESIDNTWNAFNVSPSREESPAPQAVVQ